MFRLMVIRIFDNVSITYISLPPTESYLVVTAGLVVTYHRRKNVYRCVQFYEVTVDKIIQIYNKSNSNRLRLQEVYVIK